MRAAETDTPRLPKDAAALRALLLVTLAQVDTLSPSGTRSVPSAMRWRARMSGCSTCC